MDNNNYITTKQNIIQTLDLLLITDEIETKIKQHKNLYIESV